MGKPAGGFPERGVGFCPVGPQIESFLACAASQVPWRANSIAPGRQLEPAGWMTERQGGGR